MKKLIFHKKKNFLDNFVACQLTYSLPSYILFFFFSKCLRKVLKRLPETFGLCRWNIPFLCCVLKHLVFSEIILLINSHTHTHSLSFFPCFSWPLLNTHFPHPQPLLQLHYWHQHTRVGPSEIVKAVCPQVQTFFNILPSFPHSFCQLFLRCIVVTLSSKTLQKPSNVL